MSMKGTNLTTSANSIICEVMFVALNRCNFLSMTNISTNAHNVFIKFPEEVLKIEQNISSVGFFFSGNPIVVRLGERNIASSSDDAFVQEINIIGTIPHPEYKSPSRYNDIALLRLEHAVTPNLDVRPACLHTSLNFKGGVIAIGWGNTEDGGEQSDILQKVPLQLFDVQRCNKTFRGQSSLQNGIMDNLQICAGSFSEEKDTCQVCMW